MGEEKARLDFEKKEFTEYREQTSNKLRAAVENLTGSSIGEMRNVLAHLGEIKKIEDDLSFLLIDLFYPLSETKYIEQTINNMPDRKAKELCKGLLGKMREGNRKEGIINPLMDLVKEEAGRVLGPLNEESSHGAVGGSVGRGK